MIAVGQVVASGGGFTCILFLLRWKKEDSRRLWDYAEFGDNISNWLAFSKWGLRIFILASNVSFNAARKYFMRVFGVWVRKYFLFETAYGNFLYLGKCKEKYCLAFIGRSFET